jgi:hypothetical protein
MSNFQAIAVTVMALVGLLYALLKRRRAKAPALHHILLASGKPRLHPSYDGRPD